MLDPPVERRLGGKHAHHVIDVRLSVLFREVNELVLDQEFAKAVVPPRKILDRLPLLARGV